VTVGLDYDVRPGCESAFEAAYRDLAAALRGVPGHVRSRLYRDVERPASYLIHSEWEDRESFTSFVHSEAFARLTDWGRAEILAAPPRHRVYTDPA
jgi:heme-degrading monooxygenase HmoA